MTTKYFYFVFDEQYKILEVATCVDHPKQQERDVTGKLRMVTFNMNILKKDQILEHIQMLDDFPHNVKYTMRVITNLFF